MNIWRQQVSISKKRQMSALWALKHRLWQSLIDSVNKTEHDRRSCYLSFQGVLARRRGRSGGKSSGRVTLFNRHPPVKAGVACGPAARAHDVRTATADQSVGEGMALLWLLELSLGQALSCATGVPYVRAHGTGFRDGRVRGRMSGPGVVHLGPNYCPCGGA